MVGTETTRNPRKQEKNPPRQMINMIFGWNGITGFTFSVAKKAKNDALEISLNVLDFKIKSVLVGPGSSTNIIQWRNLEQAKLIGSIIPATKLITGFNLASVTNRGEILLLTNAEEVTKTTLFEVVDTDIGYNIILGRPWLHEIKVVPSTYHQLLKFLTPEGIKQIRGDQSTTREMNAILVSSSKGKERAT
ncbi:PREDICTED: uncharacterized protein LOC109230355 [Nicotiana attenuata]|uniref:uncharacterized protein LOC109230355 n=1 Tax=Nicotiana attenuata TaxID=49451 RepID=UPI000905B279|nr:PREDICTED: uncharacterized protein LOC109230355 [Nicotiana attenuata]